MSSTQANTEEVGELLGAGRWDLYEKQEILFSDLGIEYLEHAQMDKAANTFRVDIGTGLPIYDNTSPHIQIVTTAPVYAILVLMFI